MRVRRAVGSLFSFPRPTDSCFLGETMRYSSRLNVRISCAIACSVLGFSLASCRLRVLVFSKMFRCDLSILGLVEKKGFPRASLFGPGPA